jgi:hypothetical protein
MSCGAAKPAAEQLPDAPAWNELPESGARGIHADSEDVRPGRYLSLLKRQRIATLHRAAAVVTGLRAGAVLAGHRAACGPP